MRYAAFEVKTIFARSEENDVCVKNKRDMFLFLAVKLGSN